MANPELRKAWRENWLGSLQEIADEELQRSTWLNPQNGNPHYSFIEYNECYFDGLLLNEIDGGYAARVSEGLLSTSEACAVEGFHRLLDNYEPPNGDDYDHAAILADEDWQKVVAAAQSVRAMLRKIISDPAELSILFEPSAHGRLASRRDMHRQGSST